MVDLTACGPGEQGEPGVNGRDGSGLEKATTCLGLHTFPSTGQIALEHVRYDFADGSALVMCGVTTGSGEVISNLPRFYGRYDAGYKAVGHCVANYNAEPNANFAQFEFNVAPGAATGEAVYKAIGSDFNNTKVSLNCRQSG